MKYKKLTPHEFAQKTVIDIEKRRKAKEKGSKQAFIFYMENRERIRKRLRGK